MGAFCLLSESVRAADRHDMPQSCLPLSGRRIGEASQHLSFDHKSGGANTVALVVGGFVRKNAAERGCGQEAYAGQQARYGFEPYLPKKSI